MVRSNPNSIPVAGGATQSRVGSALRRGLHRALNPAQHSTWHRTRHRTSHMSTHISTISTIFVKASMPAAGKELRRKRGNGACLFAAGRSMGRCGACVRAGIRYIVIMSTRRAFLLSPYALPTDHPMMLTEPEMAAWWNGYLALWHPAVLAGLSEPPKQASQYDHENPQAEHVY